MLRAILSCNEMSGSADVIHMVCPDLGQEVGGHAHPALPGAEGGQGEILVRHHSQLRLQQRVQNWNKREIQKFKLLEI